MEKSEKLTTLQICNILGVNKNTRSYIEHKYKGKSNSERVWKKVLKKDGLSF